MHGVRTHWIASALALRRGWACGGSAVGRAAANQSKGRMFVCLLRRCMPCCRSSCVPGCDAR